MVAQRTLTPYVRVRILLPLPKIDILRKKDVDFFFFTLNFSLFTNF